MRKPPILLTFIGISLILASLSFPPLLWKRKGIVEGGTYELIRCDASYLILVTDTAPCVSAYTIKAELLGSGSELEFNVTQPMISANRTLTFELKRGDTELRGSYLLNDGGTVIPADRGSYELRVVGDRVEVYELRTIKKLDLAVEKDDGKLKILCLNDKSNLLDAANPFIMIYSPNDVSYEIEAYGETPELTLLLLGTASLALAAVSRYVPKSGRGDNE